MLSSKVAAENTQKDLILVLLWSQVFGTSRAFRKPAILIWKREEETENV